jgi:hypothetical protein
MDGRVALGLDLGNKIKILDAYILRAYDCLAFMIIAAQILRKHEDFAKL